jgi:hypothetical protein
MLTKNQAIKLVRNQLPDGFDIMEDHIVEREYGWVIFSQTKKYIESQDPLDMAVGSGGTLVEKESGCCIEFGSAYSTETNLEIYEKGYLKYDNLDILITDVEDLVKAAESLSSLGITYVISEEECGTTWRIPQHYSLDQIKVKLRDLPCRFNLGSAYFIWEALDRFKSQNYFRYELVENYGYTNTL